MNLFMMDVVEEHHQKNAQGKRYIWFKCWHRTLKRYRYFVRWLD